MGVMSPGPNRPAVGCRGQGHDPATAIASLAVSSLLLVIATVGAGAGCRPAPPPPPPNVLVILSDDQGWGDLSLHGNPDVRTPRLDALARSGVSFDRFYVSPLCSPTRASFLTGRDSLRGGVWGVTRGKETLRAEEVTLAEILGDAGYRTAGVGKWHNGEHYPYSPEGQGFETFFGFRRGHWNNYFDTWLLRGNTPERTDGYINDVLTDEALAVLAGPHERPLFLYLAYNTPHSPFQVPDEYFDRVKARGLDDRTAAVYAMVESLDDNVGRILDALAAQGLARDTIVVFFGDNGPNGARFNGGMRGTKGSVHEGGVRVPCFVAWPDHLAPGQVAEIASGVDLLPTLLDLAGVPVPEGLELDGRSLRPLLEGNTTDWPDRTLFSHRFGNRVPEPTPGAVRTQRYRAVNEGEGWQLYDMETDPGEQGNIAEEHPDLTARLAAQYEAWFEDVTREGFSRFPIPVGHPEEDPVSLPATQAWFEGGVAYEQGQGWANDWLTSWTGTNDRIWWELDVVEAGTYDVSLEYLCPVDEAGARVRASAGESEATATVAGTALRQVPSPDRVPRKEVYEMEWEQLPLGPLQLPRGRVRLTLEAVENAQGRVLDLMAVRLDRRAAR
jgi:arylsulfatase A-like enzyme